MLRVVLCFSPFEPLVPFSLLIVRVFHSLEFGRKALVDFI